MCQLFIFINATFAFFLFSCVLGNITVFFVCFFVVLWLVYWQMSSIKYSTVRPVTHQNDQNDIWHPVQSWILSLKSVLMSACRLNPTVTSNLNLFALYSQQLSWHAENVYERLCGNQMYIWLWFTVMTTTNK